MLNDADLDVIERHESSFISFKILNDEGKLLQFDCLAKGIRSNIIHLGSHSFEHPVPFFFIRDPFRSHKTTSIFCYDPLHASDGRQILASKLLPEVKDKKNIDFYLSFFILPLEKGDMNDYIYSSDPTDIYADLRADIALLLENANIQIACHYHGEVLNECVIGIRSEGLIKCAEETVVVRYIVENTAKGYGYGVKFADNNQAKANMSLYVEQDEPAELEEMQLKDAHMKVISARQIRPAGTEGETGNVMRIDILTKEIFNPFLVISELLDYVPLNFV